MAKKEIPPEHAAWTGRQRPDLRGFMQRVRLKNKTTRNEADNQFPDQKHASGRPHRTENQRDGVTLILSIIAEPQLTRSIDLPNDVRHGGHEASWSRSYRGSEWNLPGIAQKASQEVRLCAGMTADPCSFIASCLVELPTFYFVSST
jgi:hypothetical protein